MKAIHDKKIIVCVLALTSWLMRDSIKNTLAFSISAKVK